MYGILWTHSLLGFHLEDIYFKILIFLPQNEIDKIVATTESMTETIQSLKNKIQILTNDVEEEEQKMKQVMVKNHIGSIFNYNF